MLDRSTRRRERRTAWDGPLAGKVVLLGAGLASATLGGCGVAQMAAPGMMPHSARTQDPKNQGGLLSMFAPPSPQTAAAWATDRYDPDLRYRGTLLLGTASWGGEPLYLALYEQHAHDPEPNVRVAALRALGNHGGPEHAGIMVEALGDAEERVRCEAARSLQRVFAPDVSIDPLLDALHADRERSAEVRAAAAIALGQYPQNRVLQALIAGLNDRSLAVNRACADSLRVLTGQDFGYDGPAWTHWAESQGQAVFAARGTYTYPVFNRPRKIHEILLPFLPQPVNEQATVPAGTPMGQ